MAGSIVPSSCVKPVGLEEEDRVGCGLIVGVIGATHRREEREAFSHTHVIEDIRRLPAILDLPMDQPVR